MDINELENQLDNWKNVEYRMNNEGIYYCFKHYSNWNEIEDEEFHKLKSKLLDTIQELTSLVENRIETLENKIENLEL